jgi:hypothetical protein
MKETPLFDGRKPWFLVGFPGNIKPLGSTSLAWKLAWGCKHVGKSQLVGQYREQGIKWGSRFLERDLKGPLRAIAGVSRTWLETVLWCLLPLEDVHDIPWPPETGTTGVSLEVWRTGGVWILRAPCRTMPQHPREVLGKVTVCHYSNKVPFICKKTSSHTQSLVGLDFRHPLVSNMAMDKATIDFDDFRVPRSVWLGIPPRSTSMLSPWPVAVLVNSQDLIW